MESDLIAARAALAKARAASMDALMDAAVYQPPPANLGLILEAITGLELKVDRALAQQGRLVDHVALVLERIVSLEGAAVEANESAAATKTTVEGIKREVGSC